MGRSEVMKKCPYCGGLLKSENGDTWCEVCNLMWSPDGLYKWQEWMDLQKITGDWYKVEDGCLVVMDEMAI